MAYLIGIGTPLQKYDFQFLSACRKPLLLVHGERDEFGDVEQLRKFVGELEKSTPVELVTIPDVGHFFDERLDELKRAITDWVTKQLAS